RPEYHLVSVQGVPFIFLNGGSCGLLSPEQRGWFREQVRRHHRPGRTLVIVLHQPSLGSVVAERGIPAAVREALADCRGDLWMVRVGEGAEPYRVETQAAWCLNYWHYGKRLVYRFPLVLARGQAKRCVVLNTPSGKDPPRYFLSPDGKTWEEVTRVERHGSE